jgi:ferric-dicitrate binding protein FerR (iron transport regulator)
MRFAVSALIALGLAAAPAAAFDKNAYKAAVKEWRADKKAAEDAYEAEKDAWKDAGKPDPKPSKPARDPRPDRKDF